MRITLHLAEKSKERVILRENCSDIINEAIFIFSFKMKMSYYV